MPRQGSARRVGRAHLQVLRAPIRTHDLPLVPRHALQRPPRLLLPARSHPPTLPHPLYTPLVLDHGEHYERAFRHYLRARRATFLTLDEARRALLPGADDDLRTLKSFDFLVYADGRNLLIDLKGRKVSARRPARLDSWVTRADVESMLRWERLFGPSFEGAFVFLYWCDAPPPDGLFQEHFHHADRWYIVRAVSLRDYAASMKTRSPRWGTVDLPRDAFERCSAPFCPAPADRPQRRTNALAPALRRPPVAPIVTTR